MAMDACRGTGAVTGARGGHPGAEALRTFGNRSFRSRKAMVGSRRRHPRSDRFLHLLRATNAAIGAPKTHATGPWRRKLSPLLAAWCRLRNRSVEFSDRDSLR